MAEMDEYRFVIDVFHPHTMPMARLAEYLGDLAELYSFKQYVHFIGVDEGSANCLQLVEKSVTARVERRLLQVETRVAKGALRKAFDDLNDRLYDDNAVGQLFRPSGR